jgi:hypothetical protein
MFVVYPQVYQLQDIQKVTPLSRYPLTTNNAASSHSAAGVSLQAGALR